MIPFRSWKETGLQLTLILFEDTTVTATACGDLLGSKGKITMSFCGLPTELYLLAANWAKWIAPYLPSEK